LTRRAPRDHNDFAMAKYRITLALTAWLFAWSCWSFAVAQLIGGHAFHGTTRSVLVELAQDHDAVYAGALRTTTWRPTLRYRWDSRPGQWAYFMRAVGRNEWPHWSGFQFVAKPTLTVLRIPWWFILVGTGWPVLAMAWATKRAQRAEGRRAVIAMHDGGDAPTRTLPYARPDLSGRLERRLRIITVACSAICILITIGDTLNGPRAGVPGWMDLVQVLTAMAATLAAANLLASPAFRGRRRRVIMLALGCFVALIVRLLLPQIWA
jgi:hypothetical protein